MGPGHGQIRRLPKGATGARGSTSKRGKPVHDSRRFDRQLRGLPFRGIRCEIYAKRRKRLDKRFILFFAAARLCHRVIGAFKHCRKAVWRIGRFSVLRTGSIDRFYRFGVRSALALYGASGFPRAMKTDESGMRPRSRPRKGHKW